MTQLANYTPDGKVQSRFEYSYNAASIRTSMTTLEGVHSYTYDDTYQLTSVNYPDNRKVEYAFDAVGNRASAKDNGVLTSYTTNELDQYTEAGAETFEYDKNGNITTRTLNGNVTRYKWDEDDQLVSALRNGVRIEYRYDHRGRLSAKKVGSREARYIWDGFDLVAEANSAGKVIRRYIYGAAINEIVLVTADGANYWCQQDGLGSIVGVTDDTGIVVATCSYDVYGNVRNGDLGPVVQRFAGMWWEEDAGLYYVRARWYDSSQGRFITVDPIGFVGGTNLYSYVGNTPTNFIDPTGMHGPLWAPGPNTPLNKRDPRNWPFIYPDWDPKKPHDPEDLREKGLPEDWPPHIPPDPDLIVSLPPDPDLFDFLLPPAEASEPPLGGICPTFVQLPPDAKATALRITHLDVSQEQLSGKITVPIDNCLLRSDIPIFGVAGGNNFKEYRVEYGEGMNPTEWHLIESSTTPQPNCDVGLAEMWLMQGDIDIRGNLATWNTGLKNWVHLPWHPADDPTDFNGIYTIRLAVEGKDGKYIEDRVTCEVGRAIAQCLPGIAVSTDKKVTMRFPEQSLMHPFRVYTIKPLEENVPKVPKSQVVVGHTYVFREPGDKFIKPVTLEFTFDSKELNGQPSESLAIYTYDAAKLEWNMLPSGVSNSESKVWTEIFGLPESKALFALFRTADGTAQSKVLGFANLESEAQEKSSTQWGMLPSEDTFEQSLSEWEPRDREVGTSVEKVPHQEADGHYIRITNKNHGGNFACTIRKTPFDVREFPIIAFDYRTDPGTKIDLYARVAGRWYDIGFTDDRNEYRNKDVNISYIGQIPEIVADGEWHSTNFNLDHMLQTKTRNHIVEELVMADWDVGGYMKLEFGHNQARLNVELDNFTIAALPIDEKSLLIANEVIIQDFELTGKESPVGGPYGVFSSDDGQHCWMSFQETEVRANRNRALQIQYDVIRKGSFGGIYVKLPHVPWDRFDCIFFRIKGEIPPDAKVSLEDNTNQEVRVVLGPYVGEKDGDEWCEVSIPISAFAGLAKDDSLINFSLAVSHGSVPETGQFMIDNIKLVKGFGSEALVANFEDGGERNLFGGRYWTFCSGAAAISCSHKVAASSGRKDHACRISYGGSIGRSFGGREFSYCAWACSLHGLDTSGFETLCFDIRGEDGNEKPNIYLDDATMRRCVDLEKYIDVTKDWQTVEIPLSDFAKQCIDLTYIEEIQIVFEWERTSGTIYVDNIRFR